MEDKDILRLKEQRRQLLTAISNGITHILCLTQGDPRFSSYFRLMNDVLHNPAYRDELPTKPDS